MIMFIFCFIFSQKYEKFAKQGNFCSWGVDQPNNKTLVNVEVFYSLVYNTFEKTN